MSFISALKKAFNSVEIKVERDRPVVQKKTRKRPKNFIVRKKVIVKGGENMKGTPAINEARELMDKVLNLVRAEQETAGKSLRGRDLALAATHFEDGCMRMIRSEHADKAYSPLLRLKEDKNEEVKTAEAPAAQGGTQMQSAAPAAEKVADASVAQPVQQAATAENQPANTENAATTAVEGDSTQAQPAA